MRRCAALLLFATLGAIVLSWAKESRAANEETAPATFALIIGSNSSVDRDLPALKYADDDAARYLDLFRLLGARTYVLSRLDDNTRRLHPQAAAEALEPRRAILERTMAQLSVDIDQARERHLETALYVVYAGHGGVDNGEGYITLEDMRITGADLARMLGPVPATHIHVIVDACASYFLAYSRGPGGERRPLHGFQDAAQLANDPRIGLLLSTSSARESHEWDGFQAGIFSHEVRSGLYGAADADGDGRVSYREVAAFVARANEAIPNEKFRPDVHIKAPSQSETLLDLRRGLGRRLDLDGAHAAHYSVEDERGVRLMDFHNAVGQAVHVVRPAPTGRVYVRRLDDDVEFTIGASPSVIALSSLRDAAPRVASRGAAHEAFSLIFTLPFDRSVVKSYVERPAEPEEPHPRISDLAEPLPLIATPRVRTTPGRESQSKKIVAWTGVALGLTTLAAGGALSLSAVEISRGTGSSASEQTAQHNNSRIGTLNTAAAATYVAGAVVLAAGVTTLFWPAARHVEALATPQGGYLGYTASF